MTHDTARPSLPMLSLNYGNGTFTNTLTGEQTSEITGVILGKRESRALWPRGDEIDPRPECVNGSQYGPCSECQFAQWRRDTPPECSEELSLLMWQAEHGQLVEITARRSQVRIVKQWLDMKAIVYGILHDQEVTIKMKPADGLHRLILVTEKFLTGDEKGRMDELAARVLDKAGFEAL